MDPAPQPITLRQSQAVWVPIVIWSFCALILIDAIVEASFGYSIRIACLMAAVSCLVYVVLARPSLKVDAGGLTVTNIWRTHRIAFGALTDVRVGGLASFFVRTPGDRERKITSWNAPGVPRRLPKRTQQPTAPAGGRSQVESLVVGRWEDWKLSNPRDPGQSVLTSAWNLRPIAVSIALIVLNIAIRLR